MKSKNLLLIFSIMSIVLVENVSALPNLNPGLWEITTETKMLGMPNMQVPSETHRQCLTPENIVPQSEGASKECQVKNIKEDGDTVSWEIVCSGKNGSMQGTGEITYKGDSLEGSMDMIIKGANMKIKNILKGHRIGECPQDQANVSQ